jgi:hypothetical protein
MTFSPKLNILSASQRLLWEELADLPVDFTLYGGTAVALHLGHRQSVDFDFFGTKEINPVAIYGEIPFLQNAKIIQQEKITLKALSYFDDGDLRKLPDDMKARIVKAVAATDLANLPALETDAGNKNDNNGLRQ